jgi:hypothetical protein
MFIEREGKDGQWWSQDRDLPAIVALQTVVGACLEAAIERNGHMVVVAAKMLWVYVTGLKQRAEVWNKIIEGFQKQWDYVRRPGSAGPVKRFP